MGRADRRRVAYPAGALALTALLSACGGEVPILMYHSVGAGKDGLSVTRAQLDEQLAFLEKEGFTTVSLAQAVAHRNLPARPVVLTFDDGFEDAVTAALPLLQQHGMKGMFFIPSGFVASSPASRKIDPATGQRYLTWDEVRQLRDAGMEIGSHTVQHGNLSKLRSPELRYELTESRRVLEAELGQRVEFFAYPFTRQRAAIRREVQKAGYRAAVVGPRGGMDRFAMQRIVVHRWTTTKDLAGLLEQPMGAALGE